MSLEDDVNDLREDIADLRQTFKEFLANSGPKFFEAAEAISEMGDGYGSNHKSHIAQSTAFAAAIISLGRVIHKSGVPMGEIIEEIGKGAAMIGDADHNGDGVKVIRAITSALEGVQASGPLPSRSPLIG